VCRTVGLESLRGDGEWQRGDEKRHRSAGRASAADVEDHPHRQRSTISGCRRRQTATEQETDDRGDGLSVAGGGSSGRQAAWDAVYRPRLSRGDYQQEASDYRSETVQLQEAHQLVSAIDRYDVWWCAEAGKVTGGDQSSVGCRVYRRRGQFSSAVAEGLRQAQERSTADPGQEAAASVGQYNTAVTVNFQAMFQLTRPSPNLTNKNVSIIFSRPYLSNGRAIGIVVVVCLFVCPSVTLSLCNRCTLANFLVLWKNVLHE